MWKHRTIRIVCFIFSNTSFVKNINSLLDIALRNDNSIIAQNAFNIFATENRRFILSLLRQEDLNTKFKQILTNFPGYVTLSRLSSILIICFNVCPARSLLQLEILEYLFPYCSYQPVLNVFCNLINMNDSEGKFLEYISSQDFVSKLLDQIRNSPSTIGSNQEKVIGQFLLLRTFCMCPQIKNFLKTKEIIKIIIRSFDDPDILILNAQWSIILDLTDETIYEAFSCIVPQAINSIMQSSNRFSKYQLFCVDFLTKLLQISNDPLFINSFQSLAICQMTKSLLMSFPNHSILHIHVAKLLKMMISKNELMEYIISEMIPFLSELLIQRDNILLSSFSWNLIEQFLAIDLTQNIQKSIQKIVFDRLEELNELSSCEYGGSLPEPQMAKPVLTPISSEQLLMLFKRMH